MEKVDYDKLRTEEVWREIPGYNGRYIMSSWDNVIDTEPELMEFNSVWNYEAERKRILKYTHIIHFMKNGKQVQKIFNHVRKDTFPDLYTISDEKVNEIKERISNNKVAVTYDLDTFNRLIYPNKLYYILDVTQTKDKKWRKPTKVEIDDKNHTFVLFKGRKYLGIGLFNLIKFKDLFPGNSKPYAEDTAKERRRLWIKKKRGSKKEYRMGIFD